jgi:hypothetical protein
VSLGFELLRRPCTIQPKWAAGIDMERLSLLKRITFGERVAEDETAALADEADASEAEDHHRPC